MLLSRSKEIAEEELQQEVKDAVITVPAVSLHTIEAA
jgi:molecular chaperone DnaK (HSP70)